MSGRTPEKRRAARDEILAATADDLRAIAPVVSRGAETGALAAFGNKDIIAASDEGFDSVDLLAEIPRGEKEVLDAYRAK